MEITVSKPPFGVDGIIGAANHVDLAEGASLASGESATATLFCAAPKTQWNSDPYDGFAHWTLNTNDAVMGKQNIGFTCKAVAEQAAPLQPNGLGTYRYAGCFKENNPGRQLKTLLYGDNNNTNAKCIAACARAGYAYCGTQYNRECWGGPTIPVQQVDEASCNYPCTGDLNQYCGGNGFGVNAGGSYISLFATSSAPGGNGTAPPPPPPAGGPTPPTGTAGYTLVGCYTEAKNGRALPNQIKPLNATVAGCIAAAAPKNYHYVGLEYGQEVCRSFHLPCYVSLVLTINQCWAADVRAAGAVLTNMAECNMACNGKHHISFSLRLEVMLT